MDDDDTKFDIKCIQCEKVIGVCDLVDAPEDFPIWCLECNGGSSGQEITMTITQQGDPEHNKVMDDKLIKDLELEKERKPSE